MKRGAAVANRKRSPTTALTPKRPQPLSRKLKKVGVALGSARAKATGFIAKNPLRVVAAASAVGFAIAKLKRSA